MDKVYIVDDKNNKLIPSFAAVATKDDLQYYLNSFPDRDDVKNAVAQIERLPLHDRANRSNNRKWRSRQVYDQPYYCLLSTKSSVTLKVPDLKITQQDINEASPTQDVISAIELLLLLDPTGLNADLKNCKKWVAGFKKGDYRFEVFSEDKVFSSSQCYALFVSFEDGKQGYLLAKGGVGILSRAETFDSLEEIHAAFARQARFQYYKQVQVVRLKVEVESLGDLLDCPKYKSNYWTRETNFENSVIYDIAADMQRQTIERALKEASFEQIQAAYEDLQDQDRDKKKKKM